MFGQTLIEVKCDFVLWSARGWKSCPWSALTRTLSCGRRECGSHVRDRHWPALCLVVGERMEVMSMIGIDPHFVLWSARGWKSCPWSALTRTLSCGRREDGRHVHDLHWPALCLVVGERVEVMSMVGIDPHFVLWSARGWKSCPWSALTRTLSCGRREDGSHVHDRHWPALCLVVGERVKVMSMIGIDPHFVLWSARGWKSWPWSALTRTLSCGRREDGSHVHDRHWPALCLVVGENVEVMSVIGIDPHFVLWSARGWKSCPWSALTRTLSCGRREGGSHVHDRHWPALCLVVGERVEAMSMIGIDPHFVLWSARGWKSWPWSALTRTLSCGRREDGNHDHDRHWPAQRLPFWTCTILNLTGSND